MAMLVFTGVYLDQNNNKARLFFPTAHSYLIKQTTKFRAVDTCANDLTAT